MERILVIGNGMASVRLCEHLVRLGSGRLEITVIGAEPAPGYNRVLLSALLANDVAEADTVLRPAVWYAQNGIRLLTGTAVAGLDAVQRIATLDDGRTIGFDRAVFATGSHAIRLPMPGIDLPGVIAFRNMADVAVMEQAAVKGRRVAVIGGGLLGIEAAYGLAKRGANVSLVHVMATLMERQLDTEAAALVRNALARRNVKVLLGRKTVAVTGADCADGIEFDDGGRLDADLVVCAVGIRPNADLAAAAGIAVGRGIVVDDGMATGVPGIYAVGECAEHRGTCYGLVEPAYAQCEALARNLCGLPAAFDGMVLATNLKVSGLPVFSAGDFMGGGALQTVTLRDTGNGCYRKLVFDGDRLAGCVLVGDADDGLWYLELIRSRTNVRAARRMLVHGRAFAEAALTGALPQAA